MLWQKETMTMTRAGAEVPPLTEDQALVLVLVHMLLPLQLFGKGPPETLV